MDGRDAHSGGANLWKRVNPFPSDRWFSDCLILVLRGCSRRLRSQLFGVSAARLSLDTDCLCSPLSLRKEEKGGLHSNFDLRDDWLNLMLIADKPDSGTSPGEMQLLLFTPAVRLRDVIDQRVFVSKRGQVRVNGVGGHRQRSVVLAGLKAGRGGKEDEWWRGSS
ncbi:hypothetical protein BJY04DRAFT_134998 [Aspergillus karnatakaensis]|uniref:uncharacterized protein n=1 Tax=Aspergillus karnatakaensis TaxID=1810916 RepID=UPI003CCD12CB